MPTMQPTSTFMSPLPIPTSIHLCTSLLAWTSIIFPFEFFIWNAPTRNLVSQDSSSPLRLRARSCACCEVSTIQSRTVDASPPGIYFWPRRLGEKKAGIVFVGDGERGGRIMGGLESTDGVPVGLGVGKTKCGRAGGLGSLYDTDSESLSSSIVGYGGVVGGGDGDEDSEMRTASREFGRRRFNVGCVGRTTEDPSLSNPSNLSSSDPVSSISSRALFDVARGKRSRLERGEACWVAVVALLVTRFQVEPKLNLGTGVNC